MRVCTESIQNSEENLHSTFAFVVEKLKKKSFFVLAQNLHAYIYKTKADFEDFI